MANLVDYSGFDEDEIEKLIRAALARTTRPPTNISPTDVDAKGKFPYQEPEVDEQGTYYGYKILKKGKHSFDPDWVFLVSPLYNVAWNQYGCLTADEMPNEHSMHGIHFTKEYDHPALEEYCDEYIIGSMVSKRVLVRCALFGTVVETAQGFRAEKAKIVGVFIHNNWISYQEYLEMENGNRKNSKNTRERSRTDSRSTAETEWWEARWNYGTWQDPDTYFNPSADS